MKRLLATAAWLFLSGVSSVRADVTTYSNPTLMVTGCPGCTVTDPTGLNAYAIGHQSYGTPNGWDVWVNPTDRLTVANGFGVDFTVPQQLQLGKTFDVTGFKIFGLSSRSQTTVPLTYNLIAYHPDGSIQTVPITIRARVQSTVNLSTYPQLKNLTKLTVFYPATSYIGKTYFIEVQFTKNP
jgi:hypothetical protein